MISYILNRKALPRERRERVLSYIQNSTQPDALLLHLHEVNEVQGVIRLARYAVVFRNKQYALHFVDQWQKIEEKKFKVEGYYIKKNTVLVFLKHPVRPTIVAQQIKSFGFKPIYIFMIVERFRSIQYQLDFCKAKFKVIWLDELSTYKKKRKISSSNSVKIIDSINNTDVLDHQRSRSNSIQKENIQEIQEAPEVNFRDLDIDKKYEFIDQIAVQINYQIKLFNSSLKVFFKLIEVANEIIEKS